MSTHSDEDDALVCGSIAPCDRLDEPCADCGHVVLAHRIESGSQRAVCSVCEHLRTMSGPFHPNTFRDELRAELMAAATQPMETPMQRYTTFDGEPVGECSAVLGLGEYADDEGQDATIRIDANTPTDLAALLARIEPALAGWKTAINIGVR